MRTSLFTAGDAEARSIRDRRDRLEALSMPALDRMSFFCHLANMVSAGIPILRSLTSMRDQYVDRSSRDVTDMLCLRLSGGASLSEAMACLPRAFTRLQVGTVRVGEASGDLQGVLARLASHEERTLSLTRHVRAVLVYPIVIFFFAVLFIIGLAHFLIAGITPLLAQAQVAMNPVTALALSIVTSLQHPLVAMALVTTICGALMSFRLWLRSAAGTAARDRFLLCLPLIGEVLRKIETTHICESLRTGYASGLPLLQCIDVAAESCNNALAREAVHAMLKHIRDGQPVWKAMERADFFGTTVIQMVNVGEESGKLESMLGRIAQYNDLDVRTALEQCTAAIEPAMIVCIGVVVAVIILVAFAPLYQLISTLS